MLRADAVTVEDAHDFASWRYGGEYAVYDADAEDWERFLDPIWAYRSLRDESGAAVGYCCFGADARVPGGRYEGDAVDLGGGLRPELTGAGRGDEFLAAVMGEAERMSPGARLRVTIAAFNRRALRMVEKAGFVEVERFTGPDDRPFVVLARQGSQVKGRGGSRRSGCAS